MSIHKHTYIQWVISPKGKLRQQHEVKVEGSDGYPPKDKHLLQHGQLLRRKVQDCRSIRTPNLWQEEEAEWKAGVGGGEESRWGRLSHRMAQVGAQTNLPLYSCPLNSSSFLLSGSVVVAHRLCCSVVPFAGRRMLNHWTTRELWDLKF